LHQGLVPISNVAFTVGTAPERQDRWGAAVFAAGCLALVVLLAWPSVGAFITRAMPPEVDDALFYLVRGQYLLECPRQDCVGTESIRVELTEKTGQPSVDVDRAYHRFVVLGIHSPIHMGVLAGLRSLGLDWMTAYWLFVFTGIGLIAAGVCIWLHNIFGPGPAGLGALLVGTTYFVGQGFAWIVPSSVTVGLTLLTAGLAARGRAMALAVAILIWLIVFMHVSGRGYAVLVALIYIAAVVPERRLRAYYPVISGLAAVALYTALPFIVARPDFRIPFGMEGITDNPLDIIINNVIETMRVTFRTTSIAGGLIPMLAVTVVGVFLVSPQRRRPLATMLVAAGGLCVFSLFHLSPRIPAELFARVWILVAVPMTGCAALVLWRAVPAVLVSRGDLWALWHESLWDARRLLTSAGWRLAAAFAVAVLVIGATLHVLVGLYAVERLRVMISARHDFAFEREQPPRLIADGCGTVWYSRAEALHVYWLYGALRCRSLIDIGLDGRAMAARGELSHAVAFNPMAQFKNWQPLRNGEPFTIRNDVLIGDGCVAPDENAHVHVRLRVTGSEAPVKVSHDGTLRRLAVTRDPQWFDLGPIPAGGTIVLDAERGSVVIGGIRRGVPGALAWPWDQGLTAEFVRDIPHQSRNAVVERFRSVNQFPFGRCLDIMDDRGFTMLARVRPKVP
jgi:hypothetical protein